MSLSKVFDRRDFAGRWSGFLKATYRNPEEVAVNFNVRFQTALNWWNGINAPAGHVVASAFLNDGENAARHLGG